MQPALVGADADPELTSTPAAIKVPTNAEGRLYRMAPPLSAAIIAFRQSFRQPLLWLILLAAGALVRTRL
jgi:hypothetical protein